MRTILVPLDGSVFGETAIPAAARLARQHRARLLLASVHTPMQPLHTAAGSLLPDPELEARTRARLEQYLWETRQRVAAVNASLDVQVKLLEGHVVTMLAQHATEARVDLVVATSHGRGGMSRLWLGSVADGLAVRLRIPMLVLRPSGRGDASSEPGPFRRVLIPVDPDSSVPHSVDSAPWIAGTDGVHFRVMACIIPLHRVLRTVAGPDAEARDAAEQEARARSYVREVGDRLREHGADVSTTVCVGTHPAREILVEAESMQADLVVVSTHARGQVGRLVLGSVADKVLRGASTPVLLDPIREPGGSIASD